MYIRRSYRVKERGPVAIWKDKMNSEISMLDHAPRQDRQQMRIWHVLLRSSSRQTIHLRANGKTRYYRRRLLRRWRLRRRAWNREGIGTDQDTRDASQQPKSVRRESLGRLGVALVKSRNSGAKFGICIPRCIKPSLMYRAAVR